MTIRFVGFDWDRWNREKCCKHGVSTAEIESLFLRGELFVAPDVRHSQTETRYLAMGRSEGKSIKCRHIFVAFTFREVGGDLYIRPISSRYMHRNEINKYEKETS